MSCRGRASAGPLAATLDAPPDDRLCAAGFSEIAPRTPEQAVPLSPLKEKRISFAAKGENRQIGENDKNK
jgi:hypothetical protein